MNIFQIFSLRTALISLSLAVVATAIGCASARIPHQASAVAAHCIAPHHVCPRCGLHQREGCACRPDCWNHGYQPTCWTRLEVPCCPSVESPIIHHEAAPIEVLPLDEIEPDTSRRPTDTDSGYLLDPYFKDATFLSPNREDPKGQPARLRRIPPIATDQSRTVVDLTDSPRILIDRYPATPHDFDFYPVSRAD